VSTPFVWPSEWKESRSMLKQRSNERTGFEPPTHELLP